MKLKYILGLCVVIVLTILYFKYNPEVYSFFPECPLHKYTGLDCPGCGSQRAVHALLHGDVPSALNFNVLLVLSLPFLLIHFILRVASFFTKKDLTWKIWAKPATPRVIFVVVILFWISRNIPVSPLTYLAS